MKGKKIVMKDGDMLGNGVVAFRLSGSGLHFFFFFYLSVSLHFAQLIVE